MTASGRSRCGFRAAMTSSTRPASSCSLIQSMHAVRSPSSGVTACTAAAAKSRAWNRSRMKVISGPARISSQTVRIQGAPSDSTTSSSALNKAFRYTNRSGRAAKSEIRLTPFTARALSIYTPAGPLFRSFRGSPVFGSRLTAVKQMTAFASLVFAVRFNWWKPPPQSRQWQ